MADDTPHGDNAPEEPTPEPGAQVPTPPETDWKAEARKWETRAKQNLDVAKANEDAAKRLAEIEDQAKTELERALERAERAEKAIAERDEADRKAKEEAEHQAALAKAAEDIVKGSKVPATALRGNTPSELAAHFKELVALIPEEPPRKGVFGPYVPPEGKEPPALNSTALEDALRKAVGAS